MATPSTTTTTTTTTSNTKPIMMKQLKTKKKSSINIKIKPFTKPPTLPTDFYNATTQVLYKSLRDILYRHTSEVSREELYKKVTDLCSHGFGPKLYIELVDLLDEAASVCMSRLIEGSDDSSNSTIQYSTPNCYKENNHVYFHSLKEIQIEETVHDMKNLSGGNVVTSEEDNIILGNIWNVYSDYVQYLNCVRLIFQSLDRMFLCLPSNYDDNGKLKAQVVPRNSSVAYMSDCTNNGLSNGAWNMWDVGINCMYRYMGHTYHKENQNDDGDLHMEDVQGDDSVVDKKHFSTLDVLKKRSIACLIEELKASLPSLTTSNTMEMFHQSSVKNCVFILKSFSTVATHSTNNGKTDVMDEFLQDLETTMVSYFTKESQSFMKKNASLEHVDPLTPVKTSYDTRFILHHVDARLKQVHSMSAYYNLSSSNASSSKDHVNNVMRDVSEIFKHHKKELSYLVESNLFSPHFTTDYILHPLNLHHILDEQNQESLSDVKLLFQLSKRVHSRENVSTFQESNANTIPSSPGMELLRAAFEAYGTQRGFSIIRPSMSPNVNISPTISSEPVKPPPQLSLREIQNQIIGNLLTFKDHLDYLLKEAFASNEYFVKTLRKLLETVLNEGGEVNSSETPDVMTTTNRRKRGLSRNSSDACDGGKRIAELLAKYVDQNFKSTKIALTASPMKEKSNDSKVSIEDEMDAFQNKVIVLFRHIQSKDVFEAFYRRDLSKRLLSNKSASIDTERTFVTKLKAECGSAYTVKMEGMFKDMDLSREVMSNYSAYLGGLEDPSSGSGVNVDTDIQVLTTGYWPVQTQHPSLVLPESLQSKKDHFESYYSSKYQGRKLTWQNSLGNCIIKANFPKISGPRELNVSLLQALVLMCFNVEDADEDPALTMIDIMMKTGIEDKIEAERVLQSLSMGRDGTQVLRRVEEKFVNRTSEETPTTPNKKHKVSKKSISPMDIFKFNADFFTNQRRIRITNIQLKESSEERDKTQESVTIDRLYLIDAAIVRIMKARKTLDHRSLIGEVMKQLKFPATGTDIKRQIEKLIDREYLERADSSTYNYLA